ncbi:MAG: hypothetical protein L0Y79_01020 [Chlorobi bacterium]|nr:hypothetical protein [Chlorobiota bacterium]MCI0716710.1 hypothetical protein [Chlorobiota bacterium]
MSSNHRKPIQSLKIFTEKLIDYAGLFPPANLNLAQSFHNYVFYSQGEYKWMLNKFVVPSGRLIELSKLITEMKIGGQIPFSFLGTGGETAPDFNKNFTNDVKNIYEFKNKNRQLVSSDVFEVRLPIEVIERENNDDMLDLMIDVSTGLEKELGAEIPVFFETETSDQYESIITRTAETIASLDRNCGFKLRTGGTEAIAFPKSEQIAFAIMACCEFNIPMKYTAGLHHPIKHFNENISAYFHGFFNVFGGGILAYTNNLDEKELLGVLNDEDPYEFVFKEDGFEWNEIEVSNSQIREAREKFIISYGSCSFDEPIDDLKTMELL